MAKYPFCVIRPTTLKDLWHLRSLVVFSMMYFNFAQASAWQTWLPTQQWGEVHLWDWMKQLSKISPNLVCIPTGDGDWTLDLSIGSLTLCQWANLRPPPLRKKFKLCYDYVSTHWILLSHFQRPQLYYLYLTYYKITDEVFGTNEVFVCNEIGESSYKFTVTNGKCFLQFIYWYLLK